jgi:general L-amino acid transport system substrate-binding protein
MRRKEGMVAMKRSGSLVALILGLLGMLVIQTPADAGDTLTRIKSRAKIRCGVSDGIPGLSFKEADGRWSGMDADFCRALSAAVLGDPAKVDFIPLGASQRFPSLKAGEIDVLVRNTTWTLEREATLEVMFAGVLYYDGQGFLVPAGNEWLDLSRLNGAAICVVKGTTHEKNLGEYFLARNWSYQPVILESQAKAAEAFMAGRCQALTSEQPQLRAVQLRAPGGASGYRLLPDRISREPMGPAVRRGDDEWFTIVRWVLFSLIRAEELGFTQATVRSRLEAAADPAASRWSELDGPISRGLGIPIGWATRVVENAGNYGELFEHNLGSQSPLKLDRGLNSLSTQGGLMYSPPFR